VYKVAEVVAFARARTRLTSHIDMAHHAILLHEHAICTRIFPDAPNHEADSVCTNELALPHTCQICIPFFINVGDRLRNAAHAHEGPISVGSALSLSLCTCYARAGRARGCATSEDDVRERCDPTALSVG